MKDTLLEIKSQLFDAPEEIKSAFNNVVAYFAPGKHYNPTEEEIKLAKFEEDLDELLVKYLKGADIEFKKDALRTLGAKILSHKDSAGPITRTCKSIGYAIAEACDYRPSNAVQAYWNNMM